MNQFNSAIDLVCASLRQFRARGIDVRASSAALENLRQSRPSAPAQALEPAPRVGALIDSPVQKVPVLRQNSPRDATGKQEALELLRASAMACQNCAHLAQA